MGWINPIDRFTQAQSTFQWTFALSPDLQSRGCPEFDLTSQSVRSRIMTNKPFENPAVDQRLLGNLRRARLEMEEVGLQLDEVIARFDEEIRQQRLKRVQKSLSLLNE
jgi:hypothetical protein